MIIVQHSNSVKNFIVLSLDPFQYKLRIHCYSGNTMTSCLGMLLNLLTRKGYWGQFQLQVTGLHECDEVESISTCFKQEITFT